MITGCYQQLTKKKNKTYWVVLTFLQKYIWLGLLVLGLINLIDYFKGIENIYSSVSLLVLSLVMFWQRKDPI